MSEAEQDAALGSLVRDYSTSRSQLADRSEALKHIAEALSALGAALRISPSGSLPDIAKANTVISALPEQFTPAWLRGALSEYSALAAKVEAQKVQLKPYGIV